MIFMHMQTLHLHNLAWTKSISADPSAVQSARSSVSGYLQSRCHVSCCKACLAENVGDSQPAITQPLWGFCQVAKLQEMPQRLNKHP